MRRTGYIFIAALLLFAGCLHEQVPETPSLAPDNERVELTFKVAVPNDGLATKAMGINPTIDPDGFYIAVFGGSGYFNEWVKATVVSATSNYDPDDTSGTNGANATIYDISTTLSVSDSRLRLHFIANCPTSIRTSPPISGSQDTEENVMSKIRSQKSETYNDGYWQKVILPNGVKAVKQGDTWVATPATLAQLPNPIVLVRNFARVYLRNLTPIVGDSQLNNSHQLVTIKKFALAYAPSEGVIAPILGNPYTSDVSGAPITVSDDDDSTPVYLENFFINYQNYPITSSDQNATILSGPPFNFEGYSPSDQAYAYYPNNSDVQVPLEADMQVWDNEHPENNVLYVYERTVPTTSRRATRIIIKAERRDQNSVEPYDAHSEGDKYYAVDIVNTEGVAIALLRNQTYTVHLLDIESGSGETDLDKAATASSATVSGDPNYQNLINISDGKSSIGTSFTEKFYVKPQVDSVMFRYIPTNITDDNYTANTEGNELVNIKVGTVNIQTGVFTELTPTQASSQGVLAFKTENGAYKVWIEKKNNVAIPFVRSNNSWVEATAAQIADQTVEKWGMVKYELSESYKDANDYFTEERMQAIHVVASYGGREMSRNVVIKTSPRQEIRVTCLNKYVLKQSGQPEDVEILIPTGLSRSVFPLDFFIEPNGYSLTPNGDSLPVDYGTSIDPENDGPAFYFVKSLTQSAYDALPTVGRDGKNWKKFVCHFKTTVTENACTIYVKNQYFNDALAHDSFLNYEQRLFTGVNGGSLTLPSTVYRHGNATFTFVMDYAHSNNSVYWWDPANTQGQSSNAEAALANGLSLSNRVLPLIMTVTLNGFTPQYQEDGETPVTSGLEHKSGNTYLYYVGTGEPYQSTATVNLALKAMGAVNSTASVTLSTVNLEDNPGLYAEATSSEVTIQGATFSTVRFGQTNNTTIDPGIGKTTTFTFTYTSGMVVPITVELVGLEPVPGNVENNAYLSSNGDGTYTFTPVNPGATTYYLSLRTTTRFSPCTVTLSHEDYETASKTASRGSFTIPVGALYIRGISNTNPVNFTTGSTYVYLNNSSNYSYKARTRYANTYQNSSAQTVTLSDFTIVDDDATVYFIYRGASQYNGAYVYYYATSTLSELLAAENSNAGRVTLTFAGPVKIATTNSNYSLSDNTQTEGGVTVSFSNIYQVQSNRLDMSQSSDIIVSVPEGYHITSFVMTYYRSNNITYYPGSYRINSGGGSYSNGGTNNTKGTWKAENNTTSSVTLTLSGQNNNRRVAITDVVVSVEKN